MGLLVAASRALRALPELRVLVAVAPWAPSLVRPAALRLPRAAAAVAPVAASSGAIVSPRPWIDPGAGRRVASEAALLALGAVALAVAGVQPAALLVGACVSIQLPVFHLFDPPSAPRRRGAG